MADQQSEMIDQIIEVQRSISRAVTASAPSVWVDIDLSMAQLKTLMTLYSCGAAPIGQIAESLGIGQPTASHLVDRLVQTQLVLRMEDPLDRRRTLAQLSPDGEDLVERINQLRFGTLRRWLAQLDQATLTTFLQALRALADVARAETTPTSEIT
jgi:DNA-binding MarR family transcriptional regulator